MAFQRLAGMGVYTPNFTHLVAPTSFTSTTLDAAADRITFVGRFIHKDHATKTVDGVGFSLGAVVKTALSTLSVSLQDVDLTTGPPYREDGTEDQTLTIANADAGFVTNAWYEAGFDAAATRSLTPGDRIAVVFKFGTFNASDTVAIRTLGLAATFSLGESGVVTNLTGSYAAITQAPNVVLRCSDGTYGTIEGAWPCSAVGTANVNVNSGTADEYAMGVQFPYPTAVDGIAVAFQTLTATDNTEILLYDGTTALATATVDHNADRSAAFYIHFEPIAEQTLTANTLYRVAVRPTGTNNITVYWFDVAFPAHFQCHPGGDPNWHQWTRLNQGAWGGEVTTRRMFAGVRSSAYDNGQGIILRRTVLR